MNHQPIKEVLVQMSLDVVHAYEMDSTFQSVSHIMPHRPRPIGSTGYVVPPWTDVGCDSKLSRCLCPFDSLPTICLTVKYFF